MELSYATVRVRVEGPRRRTRRSGCNMFVGTTAEQKPAVSKILFICLLFFVVEINLIPVICS